MSNKVALIILFNHNYELNIGDLKKMYTSRFDHLFFIMPFYEGEDENIISVYENSFYFQGYVSKALEKIKSEQYDHYIIIGDDVLLNPCINQDNYNMYFKIDRESAFIPGPFLLNDTTVTSPYREWAPYWPWIKSALNFKIDQPGIEVSKFLPGYEEAVALLRRHGLKFSATVPLKMFYSSKVWKSIFNKLFRGKPEKILTVLLYDLKNINKKIPYPLIGSYSDIIVVPNENVDLFIRYCGIFSALHLFVEIAIPTALAFSVTKIVSEADLNFKGITHWNPEESKLFSEKFQSSRSKLYDNFPDHTLYIHPIKLSAWVT